MIRSLCLALAFAVLAGCAPQRDELLPAADVGSAGMAVLASDGMAWDIVVMDTHGNEVDRIDANLSYPTGISHHPDGFFLVGQEGRLMKVEMDGSKETFNSEPFQSGYLYRTSVTNDGNVTVSEEYDASELDEDGDVILYNQGSTEYCWMDAAPSTHPAGDTVLLDIFGPTLAAWDTSSNAWDYFVTVPGAQANIVGLDRSGDYWLAQNYGDQLWLARTDGSHDSVGRLGSMGIDAWGIHAVETAGLHSVFVLFEGGIGAGIAEVDADGRASELVVADGEAWIDLTVF